MEYSDDHGTNDACLAIINDGDGEMCGCNYSQRKEAARHHGLVDFRVMASKYSVYRQRHFDAPALTRRQIIDAASIVFHYYEEHIKECAR